MNRTDCNLNESFATRNLAKSGGGEHREIEIIILGADREDVTDCSFRKYCNVYRTLFVDDKNFVRIVWIPITARSHAKTRDKRDADAKRRYLKIR